MIQWSKEKVNKYGEEKRIYGAKQWEGYFERGRELDKKWLRYRGVALAKKIELSV